MNNQINDIVTINEKIKLTKKQFEVLNLICSIYQKPVSRYLKDALLDALNNDLEEGEICDILIDKLDNGKKKDNDEKSITTPKIMNTDQSDYPHPKAIQNEIDSLQF